MWIYIPRNRRGLSKKLAHNWHGPYRIVEFLSPVHCILRAVDNRHISTTVHVTRLKRYVDPADRPTRTPLTEVDEPFLSVNDLPPDSFMPDTELQDQPSSEENEPSNPTVTEATTAPVQPPPPVQSITTPAPREPAPVHTPTPP